MKYYVRDVTCADHIEKLYFSAGYESICIYCAGAVDEVNTDFSLSAVNVHNQSCPAIGSHSKPVLTCTSFIFVSCVLYLVFLCVCTVLHSFYTMVSYYTCLCVVCVQENYLVVDVNWLWNAIMNNDNDRLPASL